jgi:putative oxidoreductase
LRILDRLQPLALLLLRLALGSSMVGHGYLKLFHGLSQHAHTVASLGLPAWLGYVSAFTEFLGGIALLAGIMTRPAAFFVCINMAVAIWKVHWHNGLIGEMGYEFPLALAAIAFALVFFGPGPISLDHVFRGGGSGPKPK